MHRSRTAFFFDPAERWSSAVFRWNLSTREAFIITSDHLPLQLLSSKHIEVKIKEILPPIVQSGKIPVRRDYRLHMKGVTSTLGRGGSDYTASIIGSTLGAQEIQSDGRRRRADSRSAHRSASTDIGSHFHSGKPLNLHTRCKGSASEHYSPAVEKKIRFIAMNSKKPDRGGTRISDPPHSALSVKSIASKKGIQSSHPILSHAYGIRVLEMIFSIFNKYKTPVDLVSTRKLRFH